ncbi:TPA: glycosyltransferase [Serratia marcescens]
MKIALINTLYAPYKIGGAEVSVQLLAESLQRAGHEVGVFCLHEFDEIKYDTLNGVHIAYLPLKNMYWPFQASSASKLKKAVWHLLDSYNPFMARAMRKELRKFSPDVVHTNNLSGFSVAAWRVAKKLGAAWYTRLAIIIYSIRTARCLNMAKIWTYSRLQCASHLF